MWAHLLITLSVFEKLLIGSPPVATSAKLVYRIANTPVEETDEQIVFRSVPPLTVVIRPGGRLVPTVATDEIGNIYVGNKIVNSRTRKVKSLADKTLALPNKVDITAVGSNFRIARALLSCTFTNADLGLDAGNNPKFSLEREAIRVATSPTSVVTLSHRTSDDGESSTYSARLINLRNCRIDAIVELGDPDMLVELNSSLLGGFWITGSLEQTLLHSQDGERWAPLTLPTNISALISSYYVNSREIWLAAAFGDDLDTHPYMLIYSNDGGKNWQNLAKNDPLLAKVPAMWLEGQSRIAGVRCEASPCN